MLASIKRRVDLVHDQANCRTCSGVMKYRRLYKLNARQDEESNFWPSEGSKTESSYKNRNHQPADEINDRKKVKSLAEAMQRILSMGEQQLQQRSASSENRAKSLGGCDQCQGEVKKSENGSCEKTANS